MSSPQEMWSIVYQPVQELKAQQPDMSWIDRRGEFLGKPGVSGPAIEELIQELDRMPDEERMRFLGTDELDSLAYQLIERHAPVSDSAMESDEDATTESYDEAAWANYLATNGPAWNGLEDSWTPFRDWFAYHAADAGLGAPAIALLDHLESLSVAERITLFAQYGVFIQLPETVRPDAESVPVSTRPNGGGGTQRKRKREETPAEKKPEKGRGEPDGGDRDEDRDDDEPERKRPRFTGRELTRMANLGPPTLRLESFYKSVKTQKLNEVQVFTFHQEATLFKPKGAPAPAKLYEFTQEVKNSYETRSADETEPGTSEALGEFEWDKPYGPPYTNPVITAGPDAIVFVDDPGFSTDRKIPHGHWLTKYDVYFRWKVVRLTDDAEWLSPEVHHSLTCDYNGGADAAVTFEAAGDEQWTVEFDQ